MLQRKPDFAGDIIQHARGRKAAAMSFVKLLGSPWTPAAAWWGAPQRKHEVEGNTMPPRLQSVNNAPHLNAGVTLDTGSCVEGCASCATARLSLMMKSPGRQTCSYVTCLPIGPRNTLCTTLRSFSAPHEQKPTSTVRAARNALRQVQGAVGERFFLTVINTCSGSSSAHTQVTEQSMQRARCMLA